LGGGIGGVEQCVDVGEGVGGGVERRGVAVDERPGIGMLRAGQRTIDGGSHVGEGLPTGAVPEAGGVTMGELSPM
jgi:hypothetical protein